MEEVLEDTLREIEEKDPTKNMDCSAGFMFISMLHVASEEDGNLKFEKTNRGKYIVKYRPPSDDIIEDKND